jgi:hypothetical protein
MQTVSVRCPECKQEIEGPTAGQANRNLGLHRRSKHGYRSPDYEASRKYRQNQVRKSLGAIAGERLKQLDKARKARWDKYHADKERKASYWKKVKRQSQAFEATNHTNVSQAEACNLPACPVCGTKFYVVKQPAS